MSKAPQAYKRHSRGFEATSNLLRERIRQAGEVRGFAVTRLLTHWAEIVGEDIAGIARPIKMGYGRDGIGATLTLLTTSANGPRLQMALPKIRDKVNACYGYNAVSRILITQTAPDGFAEGKAAFTPAPAVERTPDPAIVKEAAVVAENVKDEGLRAALETLGRNVLGRPAKNERQSR